MVKRYEMCDDCKEVGTGENWTEVGIVVAAADYDSALDIACGAFADIAFSDDMTLELARAKAKRIYEQLRNG